MAYSYDVIDSASSIDGYNSPINVLKYDGSLWSSQCLPNSWIQFDFQQRMVSLTSCLIHDYCRIKSWKAEGSIDGSTFEIIDKIMENSDFLNSPAIRNFPVQPNNAYYRYIRITLTSKNWSNLDWFCLYHVEYFGFV